MNMGFSDVESLSQITTFFLSGAFGAATATVYSAFSAVRHVFLRRRIAVFFADILFFVISAFGFYLFLLVRCKGAVRGYAVLGYSAGFFAFELTLGRLVSSGLSCFLKGLRRIARLIMRRVICPAVFALRRAGRISIKKSKGIFKKPKAGVVFEKTERENRKIHVRKHTVALKKRKKSPKVRAGSYSKDQRHKDIQNSPIR